MLLSGILTKSHIIGEFQFSQQCAPVIVMGCFLLLRNGLDYTDRYTEALRQLTRWVRQGLIQYRKDILEGIEH